MIERAKATANRLGKPIRSYIQPDREGIDIDIGANLGCYTTMFFDDVMSHHCHAFEPLRANYEDLQKQFRTCGNVTVHHAAVSDFDGEADLYVKPTLEEGNHGSAGSSLKHDKMGVSHTLRERVKVIRLSSFMKDNDINHVRVLKIDAEGSEYDILRDLLNNGLMERFDHIFYEDHARKCLALLKDRRSMCEALAPWAHRIFVQVGHELYLPLDQDPWRSEHV